MPSTAPASSEKIAESEPSPRSPGRDPKRSKAVTKMVTNVESGTMESKQIVEKINEVAPDDVESPKNSNKKRARAKDDEPFPKRLNLSDKSEGSPSSVTGNGVEEDYTSDDYYDDANRPKGSETDTRTSQEILDERINNLEPEEIGRVRQAIQRRKEDDKAVRAANARLLKAKIELEKAQKKMEEARKCVEEATERANANIEKDADDLLLEPTPWNNYYKQLKIFYDREGHSNFKRTITEADVVGMTEDQAKELKTLSWWTCRQRKFKRRGELEQYKILLLNRLNFNWDPHAGPGPEKWLKNYQHLKDFKAKYGHVKVPLKYAENKLGSWLKTQITQYRNAKEGRQPCLSEERIRLLEEIGVCWGEKRITTPWEARFEDLIQYKERFGHANVPWQWKENIPLAQWVNSQRKKYKELLDGKRNNLTEDQIAKLTDIGFKWNTGGRGRYINTNHPVNHTTQMLQPEFYHARDHHHSENRLLGPNTTNNATVNGIPEASSENANDSVDNDENSGRAAENHAASIQHHQYHPAQNAYYHGDRGQMMAMSSQYPGLRGQPVGAMPPGLNYYDPYGTYPPGTPASGVYNTQHGSGGSGMGGMNPYV
eukprot:CAMPEP_0171418020 /NCGR_PEP_ID=MMETSP0880-20121228/40897_1 /TAXON_ID=67004 /ORGANISM="Thalassiosira weissflogii, Strain CCMP1336" /LENGTH=599 /DNA_ID=CAMNT_0011936287 /DNA_START=106 /DNA_END=1905 /DNA_ORIENTATION=-